MGKKGFVLLIVLPIILLICMIGAAFFAYQGNGIYGMRRQIASTKAFWLAEAGVSRALYELRQDYMTWYGVSSVSLGGGGGTYSVSIGAPVTVGSVTTRLLTSTGTIPSGLVVGNISRRIEIRTTRTQPPDVFFDNAICAPNVDLKGNYDVEGNITYSDSLDPNPPGESGPGVYTGNTPTQDPSINPMPRLDFEQLKDMAAAQVRSGGVDNYFSAAELASNPQFPASFWYDEVMGIPNIVYVEGNLTLNGNVGTIGGFFVVVGNVLTDPNSTGSTTINGNGSIDGCIYTTGNFDINGGGQNLNVNGGVWAGNEANLNGNAQVTYNDTYQNTIRDLNIYTIAISQWKENL